MTRPPPLHLLAHQRRPRATDEEARRAGENLLGFFRVLIAWDRVGAGETSKNGVLVEVTAG